MALNVADAIDTGFAWLRTRAGMSFMALFFVVSVLQQVVSRAALAELVPMMAGQAAPVQPLVPLPLPVAGVLWLALIAASVVVTVGAVRAAVHRDSDRMPRERFTDRIGWTVLNLVVGGLVFAVVVGIGLVLLVLPGIYLLVALLFWNIIVIVEGTSFIEAMQRSWDMTRGDRLTVFGLGVLLVVITAIIGAVVSIPTLLGSGMGGVGTVLAQAGSAVTTVLTLSVLAAAYNQLSA